MEFKFKKKILKFLEWKINSYITLQRCEVEVKYRKSPC